MQRVGLRCCAGHHRPEVGEQRLVGVAALTLKEHQGQRGSAGGQGQPVPGQEIGGGLQVELLDGDRRAAGQELGGEHADAADVGEGEDDAEAGGLGQLESHGEGPTAAQDRAIGVEGSLGVGRRPRRVEDPPDGIVAGGRGRERGRVGAGKVVEPVGDDDVEIALQSIGHVSGERLVVEASPVRRNDERPGRTWSMMKETSRSR